MIWFFFLAATMGVAGAGVLLVGLWALPASPEDLRRLQQFNLYGRWVLERLESPDHLAFSERRAYCRRYARNILPRLEQDMRDLARLCPSPALGAAALAAFRLIALAIRLKGRLRAGRNDIRGAVALQMLLLRRLAPRL